MLVLGNNLEEIIKPGRKEIDYYNDYNQLINQCLGRGLNKNDIGFYTEKHHIFPRCLGGMDKDDNYVLLSALEHIVAHILLSRSYPNNTKLLSAALTVIFMGKDFNIDKETLSNIKKIRYAARNREAFGLHRYRPVVCHDEEFNVVRVYPSNSLCKDDGFAPATIDLVISGVYSSSGGYCWSSLEDFEENYPEKLIEFNKLDKSDWPELIKKEKRDSGTFKKSELLFRKTRKSIVCTDENNNVIKIYKTARGVSEDSISGNEVAKSIETGKPFHNHYWHLYSIFEKEYPEKLEIFFKSGPAGIVNKGISTARKDKIVCYDSDNNIIRVYDKLAEAKLDGFVEGSISSALNLQEKTHYTNEYKGYFWTKLSKWKDDDKLKKYNQQLDSGCLPKLNIKPFRSKIVRCSDLNGNIEKLYLSIGNVREDKIHHQNLFRHLKSDKAKGTHSIYNNSYWYYYDEFKELFPEQLKQYEENNKSIFYE